MSLLNRKDNVHPFSHSRYPITPIIVSAILICCGCESEHSARLPVFPVEGIISRSGQSLDGALIVLHPKHSQDPRQLPARGTVGPDGHFSVTTYEAHDGAAAGFYDVTIIHNPLVFRDGDYRAGPNVLPTKYANATTTDLHIEVAAENNSFPNLKIK